MPKSRNAHTERAIRSAALRLFMQKGYAAASYTDLAAKSGVARTLVQRYYPRKDLLAVGCVAAVREAAVRACDDAFPCATHPLARLYLRGQVNIATYFACDGIRRLMVDVLRDRDLTRKAIIEGFRWTMAEALPSATPAKNEEPPDEMLMAMGGLYEVVYAYLASGKMPPVAECTLPSVRAFARLNDVLLPPEGLEAHAITNENLAPLANTAIDLVEWR